MEYVDLHSHVLYGIDDGARTLDDSLEMLRLLGSLGFSTVCATPHQKEGSFVPDAAEIAQRHDEVRAKMDAGMTLYVAAENFWDELFLGRAKGGVQPGYRQTPPEHGKAFLFELPVAQVPLGLEQQLFALRLRGFLPVMAHPERYAGLWGKDDRLEGLARCAALVIDLAALDGAHGPQQAKAARNLVQKGLCHAAASDVHQVADIRPVAAGMNWIKKKFGAPHLEALLSQGPRQILAGELPDLPA